MWSYDKKLQYPVNIKTPNPAMAKIIMTQLGGPDGEAGAAMRYLHQRYACPYSMVTGTLTDIGTEELGHMEMISAIVYQLTKGMTIQQIKDSGFDAYFVDHTAGILLLPERRIAWTTAVNTKEWQLSGCHSFD